MLAFLVSAYRSSAARLMSMCVAASVLLSSYSWHSLGVAGGRGEGGPHVRHCYAALTCWHRQGAARTTQSFSWLHCATTSVHGYACQRVGPPGMSQQSSAAPTSRPAHCFSASSSAATRPSQPAGQGRCRAVERAWGESHAKACQGMPGQPLALPAQAGACEE